MPTQISINCRYLLWRRGLPRDQWGARLVGSGLTDSEVRHLLSGRLVDEKISTDCARLLCREVGLGDDGEETLRFSDLPLESSNVLQENLRHMFATLGHGGKRSLAENLDVDPTTISRWLSGAYEPQPASIRMIVGFFGLPADTDLRTSPVFLSIEPISVSERRQWLQARLAALSADELQELYPALKRLLEER